MAFNAEFQAAFEAGFGRREVILEKGKHSHRLHRGDKHGRFRTVEFLSYGELAVVRFSGFFVLGAEDVNVAELAEGFGEAAVLGLEFLGNGDGFFGGGFGLIEPFFPGDLLAVLHRIVELLAHIGRSHFFFQTSFQSISFGNFSGGAQIGQVLLEALLSLGVALLRTIPWRRHAIGFRGAFINCGLMIVVQSADPVTALLEGDREAQARLKFLGRESNGFFEFGDGGFVIAGALKRLREESVVLKIRGIDFDSVLQIWEGGGKVFFGNEDATGAIKGKGVRVIELLGFAV